jgi:hypothetical protein
MVKRVGGLLCSVRNVVLHSNLNPRSLSLSFPVLLTFSTAPTGPATAKSYEVAVSLLVLVKEEERVLGVHVDTTKGNITEARGSKTGNPWLLALAAAPPYVPHANRRVRRVEQEGISPL